VQLLAAVQSTTGGAAQEAAAQPGLLQYLNDGGVVSYVLLALSVVALGMLLRNVLVMRVGFLAPPRAMQALEGLFAAGKIDAVRTYCEAREHRSFVTNVVAEGLRRHATERAIRLDASARASMEAAALEEADELHRVNDGLAIIAAVGPMLGLLGTVIGMIGAFRTIGSLEGAARSSQLAVFMSMALVNTAQGLIVAIPCTIAFSLFRRRIDRVVAQIGRDLERFASAVAKADAIADAAVLDERAPDPVSTGRRA
jgi:biopolymer transport protein ExbB